MQRKDDNGIHWLEFDLLTDIPRLKHGVFLRLGGFSQEPYDSLNLSDTVGDNFDDVLQNKQAVANVLNIHPSNLITMCQCHGNQIFQATAPFKHEPECDALTTTVPGIGLMARHADCQAAILYDPIHHAVATVHSGWRGSAQNIYSKTIQFMQMNYQTNPNDLLVGISPSLGPLDAEFIHYRTELPESFWDFQVVPNYFDFWAISRDQLERCGVLPHHIEIAGISTFAYPDEYFSYRRRKMTGRNGTIAVLG